MSGRNNGTVDKFGRQKINEKSKILRGPPGEGFRLSSNGNYDMQGRALENLASPKNFNDAATLEYVVSAVDQLRVQLINSANKDIKTFFEQTYKGFDEKLNILNQLIIKNDEKYYDEGASREYVVAIIDQLRVQLTDLINTDIRQYFGQKYTDFEKKLGKLNEFVKKNEATIDSVNKDISRSCEQKYQAIEVKIDKLKELIIKTESKTDAIVHKFSTWIDR